MELFSKFTVYYRVVAILKPFGVLAASGNVVSVNSLLTETTTLLATKTPK